MILLYLEYMYAKNEIFIVHLKYKYSWVLLHPPSLATLLELEGGERFYFYTESSRKPFDDTTEKQNLKEGSYLKEQCLPKRQYVSEEALRLEVFLRGQCR